MKLETKSNNVVVIGAGPVGISAAAQLIDRGITPIVLEKGPTAGHAMLEWGHVRLFTPWAYVTDKAVSDLLEAGGWHHPDRDHLPTGREIVEQYLIPAADTPQLKKSIIYDAEVIGVSKRGLSKSSSLDRDDVPYTVQYRTGDGRYTVIEADAIIDASGTWSNPNPIGADGLPVPGEGEFANAISYGIPEIFGKDRSLYAGKKTLVLGGGHSAINVVLDILSLKQTDDDTKLIWGLRRNRIEKLLGGGINDQLPARGALGIAAKKAIEEGVLEPLAPMSVRNITRSDERLCIEVIADGETRSIEVDRIVVAAGFRPDLNILREVRLDLDDVVEAPTILAPMIDPNLHSCGTVRPHGVDELSHTDKNIFIVGMKSYGRAPTFLMKTGYEQVRSIADELAGNCEAARKIELDLPESGVCSSRLQTSTKSTSDIGSSGGCCEPVQSTEESLPDSAQRCCG